MSNIWFTSDTHFGHNREFIYKPRGFDNIWEHDKTIMENWNKVVQPEDDVYHLGDIMLGDNIYGLSCLKNLKGNIHIIKGNHDTNTRMNLYKDCWNVVEISEGQWFKYGKYNFYLNHFPTITSNLEKSSSLKEHLINLYGHTHQQSNFYNDIPFLYHVGLDSHNNTPVHIDTVIEDIKEKVKECQKYL
jgi:calcineurin-like phosphoesterase family protein